MGRLDYLETEEEKEESNNFDYLDKGEEESKSNERFDYLDTDVDSLEGDPENPSWLETGISFLDVGERALANPLHKGLEEHKEGGGVFDVLKSAGEGFTDAFKAPGNNLANKLGLPGAESVESKDWFDVVNDHTDFSQPTKFALGFGASMALDPVNYLGGGLTETGKLAKKVSNPMAEVISNADDIDEVKNVLKNSDIEEGSKVYDDLLNAFDEGKDLTSADGFADEVRKGQRALVNFKLPPIPFSDSASEVSKPLIKGEGIMKGADKVKEGFNSSLLGDAFNTRPQDVADTAWDTKKNYDNYGQYRVAENAIKPNKEFYEKLSGLSDEIPNRDITEFIETGNAELSDDMADVIKENMIKRNQQHINAEKEMGLITDTLDSDMGYFPRKMTDDARKAFEENNPEKISDYVSTIDGKINIDPHQISRTEQFKDLSTSQINELNQRGEFQDLLGDYNGKVFEDNPAVAQAYRDLAHEQRMNNAEFIQDLIDKGLQEDFVKNLDEVDEIPEGFKTIEDAGDYQKLLDGYAIREPESKLIEGKKAINLPEPLEKALDIHDKGMQKWKTGALLGGGSWLTRNAIGNPARMFQKGFDNPKTLLEAGNIVKNLRQGNAIEGTLDTARGQKDLSEAVEELSKRGVLDQGLYKDVATEISDEVTKSNPISKLVDAGFEVHRGEEDVTRLGMALDSLKKGYDYDEAAKMQRETLFDYGDLTRFESEVGKRVSPFYTFYRKNIPFQLKNMYENPARYRAVEKMREGINKWSSEEEEEGIDGYTPDFLREGATARLPVDEEGNQDFVSFDRLFPNYELSKAVKDPAGYVDSKTHPLSQLIADLNRGKQGFSGSDVPETDTLFGKAMDGETAYAIKNSFRPINTLSDIVDAGVNEYHRNKEGKDKEAFDVDTKEQLSRSLLGFPKYEYSREEKGRLAQGEASDLESALRSALIRAEQTDNPSKKEEYKNQAGEKERMLELLNEWIK